jgi:hypothetical protein
MLQKAVKEWKSDLGFISLFAISQTFSLENFDPCNFSQSTEKEMFIEVFYAAKNL